MTQYPNSTISSGQRFARLVAIAHVDSDAAGNARWRFRCDCGKEKVIRVFSVKRGGTQSCGCLQREGAAHRLRTNRVRAGGNNKKKHGESRPRSAEYRCWVGMIGRCTRLGDTAWKKYGARGIKVCDRWRSYENFLADMGRKPTPRHSIDRIDGNGNYEPNNCRWATSKQQRANLRAKVRP